MCHIVSVLEDYEIPGLGCVNDDWFQWSFDILIDLMWPANSLFTGPKIGYLHSI